MSSKHSIILNYPSKACHLYMVCPSGWLPKFIYLDDKGNLVPTASTSFSYESLNQGNKVDCYGNKSVLHGYIEGTIDITPKLMGMTLRVTSIGLPNFNTYYDAYGSKTDGTCIALGIGLKDSSSNYSNIIANNADIAIQEIYSSKDVLLCTNTYNYTSFDIRNGQVYCKYWCKSITTAAGRKAGMADTSYQAGGQQGGYPRHLGVCSNTSFDVGYYKQFFANLPTHTNLNELCPDTITDDIFSKIAIPSVNNCENLMQLKKIKEAVPPIVKIMRYPRLRNISQLYLWYKYTYSTTMMDLEEYYKILFKLDAQSKSKQDYQHLSLTYSASTRLDAGKVDQITRYNIFCNTFNGGALEMLGLDLNLSNTWDMIPFSFVVDWFVNLGDILTTIDHSDTLARMQIYSVVTSNKCTSLIYPLLSVGIASPVTCVSYTRTIESKLPVGNISVSLKNPISHIIDGSALILANRR